jgi:sRNA-binding regulator protein Hfq
MNRILITFFLALAIVLVPLGPGVRAQSVPAADPKIKSEVVDRFNKKEVRVKVRLRNGSEVKGRITQANDSGFSLTDEKTGRSTDIAYTDVVNVEGRGMSKTKKVAIGVGIGVGVLIAVVAYAITHFWD